MCVGRENIRFVRQPRDDRDPSILLHHTTLTHLLDFHAARDLRPQTDQAERRELGEGAAAAEGRSDRGGEGGRHADTYVKLLSVGRVMQLNVWDLGLGFGKVQVHADMPFGEGSSISGVISGERACNGR